MSPQESNKLRDDIIAILEENPKKMQAVYPLLHYFESRLKVEPLGKLEEKEEVSPRVAKLLLAIRDELAKLEQCPEEAYHLLYQIASPNFDKTEPWAELEKIAERGSL